MGYLSLSTLIAAVLILLPSSASSTTLLVSQTCKKVAELQSITGITVSECVKVFGSDGRSESATTLEELGVISLELLRNKTGTVGRQMEALSRSSKFSAWVKDGLKFCAERYLQEVESVEEALESYKIRDYQDAISHISSMITAPDDCETGFTEGPKAEPSPVTQINTDMNHMGVIPLAITNLLN